MERFKGFNTKADPTERLFDENECELWPEVCAECNCNLSGAREHGCHLCRPSAAQASMDAGVDGNDHSTGNTDKRFLAGDGKTTEEGEGPAKSRSQLRHRHPKITA